MKLQNLLFRTAICAVLAGSTLACSSSLTGKTEGQVVRVAIDRDRKTTTRKTSSNKRKKKTTTSIETEVDYRYEVNGRSYDGFSEKDGDLQRDFQTGSPVVVCYNPKNPSESDVFAAGTSCE